MIFCLCLGFSKYSLLCQSYWAVDIFACINVTVCVKYTDSFVTVPFGSGSMYTHLLLMPLVDVWLQVVYSRSCQPLGSPTCEPLAPWWCRLCLRQALCMEPWEASPQPVALAPHPWPHKVGCSEEEEGLVRTSFWLWSDWEGPCTSGHGPSCMSNLICDNLVSTSVMA